MTPSPLAATLYSRIDSDQLPFYFEAVDLLAFLSDMVEDLAFDMAKDGGKEVLYSDAVGDSSTVTVHIRKIRENIERGLPRPKFIETI